MSNRNGWFTENPRWSRIRSPTEAQNDPPAQGQGRRSGTVTGDGLTGAVQESLANLRRALPLPPPLLLLYDLAAAGELAAQAGISAGSSQQQQSGSAELEIHLYPGEKRMLLMRGKQVLLDIPAYGGPPTAKPGETMEKGPTDPGRFIVHGLQTYRTPTWTWSQIKWGTELLDKGNDVWYRLPSGMWGSVKNDYNITREQILGQNEDLYGSRTVPGTWVFNDFGPKAVRYFKDKNSNRRLDGGERLSGEMIHTTPPDEAATRRGEEVRLQESHGCVHIKPKDRDRLMSLDAFKSGTPLIIHEYDEKPSSQ